MVTFDATGWYQSSECKRLPAYYRRVGGRIDPKAVVVHTTDTLTGTKPAIERSWHDTPGNGACAHFIIGRDSFTQMVPIYLNGNHAGGNPHGSWKSTKTGSLVHPNTMAVGIEIECGGHLGRPKAGRYVHPDTKTVMAPEEVYVDQYGVGWHRVTPYQFERLEEILQALEALPGMQGEFPYTVAPDGGYAANNCAYYAPGVGHRIVGHVTLDPVNKTDPGVQVMEYLRKRKNA